MLNDQNLSTLVAMEPKGPIAHAAQTRRSPLESADLRERGRATTLQTRIAPEGDGGATGGNVLPLEGKAPYAFKVSMIH